MSKKKKKTINPRKEKYKKFSKIEEIKVKTSEIPLEERKEANKSLKEAMRTFKHGYKNFKPNREFSK